MASSKKRGTSNSNARGNVYDRMRRKLWLLTVWESDLGIGTCRCYRCGRILVLDTLTVDRIKPGSKGGRYMRGNIRPACAQCNSATGVKARKP
jgi:5-methylcytosine-specific restriction endonuclease McrA